MVRTVSVVLVEPLFAGNLGSVARAMANFGLSRLILVNPVAQITHETRTMAVHAQHILDNVDVVHDFEAVRSQFDFLVAFAARVSSKDHTHLRVPVTLREAAATVRTLSGNVALVFGREDFGLSNEDVARCDLVATIPTSPEYRSLNLSHAASIAFYEMFAEEWDPKGVRQASARERELLFAHAEALLNAYEHPPHRIAMMTMALRRIVGRAGLSVWEYHRMMGFFSPALKRLKAWPPKGVPADFDPDGESDPDREPGGAERAGRSEPSDR